MTDAPTTNLSGPGGLLGTPGFGVRKWGRRRQRVTTKPMTRSEAARVAALARWGKYTPKPQAPTAHAATPAATPATRRSGRGRAAPAKQTPEQRQAQRQQERQAAQQASDAERRATRDRVLTEAGIDANTQGALIDARDGNTLTAANGQALAAMGLAEQATDGSYRLTAAGRRVVDAAARGDAGAVHDTLSVARDAASTQPPKKGGGGGGGKTTPTDEEKRTEQQAKRQQTAAATASQVGLGSDQVDALRTSADAGGAPNAALATLGLIDRAGDATDQGRRALNALERGDVRGYRAALQDAASRMQREQAARQRTATTAQRRRERSQTTVESLRRNLEQQRGTTKAFAVYKAANGQLRWLSRTTTSYRDRDGEILSEAALDADSQRMTATQQFGPLRWWHAGRPDPANFAAPWGPGLDLGMCDYSTQIGRTRVESGTFVSPAIGQAVARIADRLALSPGFFHAPDQPRPDGVYTAIRTFERSLVPTNRAPAANLFTGLTVKETRMDSQEIARRFKAAIADLGLTPDQAAALGADIASTDKAAAAQGVAYKEADAPQIYIAPDGTPGLIQDGRFIALKAATPPPPAVPVDGEAVPVEAKADGDPLADMDAAPDTEPDDFVGDLSRADFMALLQEALAPLIKSMDVAGKMAGYVDEMKSMFATKAAGSDAQLAALAATVAALAGDVPAPSSSPSSPEGDIAAALKSAGPEAAPDPNAPVVPSDPNRPFAALAAKTMPDLYRPSATGAFVGWQPPE